ncbi:MULTISPECIES: NADH-quinone oxidoreductase subunit K [Thermus]|uniref:NADH-quinone oxidoreductase subunit K n=1 Tax=Thermus TaxID=270 RepID=UPI001F1CAC64|nr:MULTISPECIES: NADH-quinone oxidoreductase subunit K [Thermus]
MATVNVLVLAVLATGFLMVSRRSLDAIIRLYALQNILLALVSFGLAHGELHFVLAGLALFLLKGVAIPVYLFWLLDRLEVSHEVEGYLSVFLTLALAGALTALAFRVGGVFILPGAPLPEGVPVALSLVLLGALSMVVRKKAISQVLGFLALENGVFLLALSESHGLPLFVELGVALDAFAAVFLAGVLLFRIRGELGHLDTARMRALRG